MTELSDAVRALFDGPNYAVATVLPNGGPQCPSVGRAGGQPDRVPHTPGLTQSAQPRA